ncbi:hypothetical protein MLD38_025094 [Melastoma candidum]|uniref:Uncharacterized protein n=1 Tax=Melastoma candidum TaxID=119954 RepID=A0ACB9P145_9MYRT|nr:hypothetical protein MLD38_025094 [Melastoma candidum]
MEQEEEGGARYKTEAEAEEEDSGSVKLFVGQVPKHLTESELLPLFQEFAIVNEVNLIRDKTTRTSRGCCFVICPSRKEADKAIDACHNKRTLPGAYSPLQVKYADGELERLEHKLFIGMLPKNVTEDEVSKVFLEYGNIKDLHVLRGSQKTSKGCAFIKYETKEQALSALEALNGKHKMEGSSVPLVVKWADTEKERQARRAQKSQFHNVVNIPNADSRHPSIFGALPVGYMSPYDGYGYQGPGTYGFMQYRLAAPQNQYHNMISPVNQGTVSTVSPDISPRSYNLPPTSYVGSPYPGVPGVQYPVAYPGVIHNRVSSPSAAASAAHDSNSVTYSGGGLSPSGGQIEGPLGANLFIYHIPQEFGDQELANAFMGFGRVLSAKVYLDKATGVSKCFGFVSYETTEAAQSAISTMNGHQLGGKKLKVQLKRDNRQSNPY